MNENTEHYEVRRPGLTAWCDHISTLHEAVKECAVANRSVAPGHRVYAVSRDGRRVRCSWTILLHRTRRTPMNCVTCEAKAVAIFQSEDDSVVFGICSAHLPLLFEQMLIHFSADCWFFSDEEPIGRVVQRKSKEGQ
jgi:hypothetical protein